jgi:hypothetical protein
MVAARAGQLLDESFGSEFGEVVSKSGQAVRLGGGTERGDGMRVDFRGAEGPRCRDLSETDQGVHQGELSGIVELEAGDAFAGRGQGGFGKVSELPAIDKGFEDIVLNVQVIVDDRRHLVAQRGEIPVVKHSMKICQGLPASTLVSIDI